MLMETEKSPRAFIVRRLIRVAPLYFLATTFVATVSWSLPWLRASGSSPTAGEYVFSILFLPYIAADGSMTPVLFPGWTLNYEMMFYVCCTIALCWRSASGSYVATIAVVAWCGAAHLLVPHTTVGRFYANPIILEFIFGVLIWRLHSRLQHNFAGTLWNLALLGLIISMAAAEKYIPIKAALPADWARPLVQGLIASAAVYICFAANSAFLKLSNKIRCSMLVVGNASYSIYLAHASVIALMNLVLPKFGVAGASSNLGSLLALAFCVLFGIAIDRFIDAPVQRKLRSTLHV